MRDVVMRGAAPADCLCRELVGMSVDGCPAVLRRLVSSQVIGVCRAEGEVSDFVASDVSVTQTQEDQRQSAPSSSGPRDP